MNVSGINNYSSYSSFRTKKQDSKKPIQSKESDKVILEKKVKQAVSQCTFVVLGIGILFFGMKKNLKQNRLKEIAKKAEELSKIKVPEKMNHL